YTNTSPSYLYTLSLHDALPIYSLAFAYVISNAVEENNFENSFSVYPNPSNGAFELRIANWQNCGLKIYNTLGQIVHQAEIHNPRSEEHTSELQSQSNLVCRLLL